MTSIGIFDLSFSHFTSIFQLQNEGSGLLIRGAQPSDEGAYTCLATNAAGNATLNVRVQVVGKSTPIHGAYSLAVQMDIFGI